MSYLEMLRNDGKGVARQHGAQEGRYRMAFVEADEAETKWLQDIDPTRTKTSRPANKAPPKVRYDENKIS